MSRKHPRTHKQVLPARKRRSASYLIIMWFHAILAYAVAVLFILFLNEPLKIKLIATLMFLTIGTIYALSGFAVYRRGADAIPPQVIFPLPALWKGNGIDPFQINKHGKGKTRRWEHDDNEHH